MDEPTHRIVVDLSKPPEERVKRVNLKASEKTAIKAEWQAEEDRFDRYANRLQDKVEILIRQTAKVNGFGLERLAEKAVINEQAKALLIWKLNIEDLVEAHIEAGIKDNTFFDNLPIYG